MCCLDFCGSIHIVHRQMPTSMHSSRMRTARLLTVSRSIRGDVCIGRRCLPRGVSVQRGSVKGCLPRGCLPGGCVCPGGVSAQGMSGWECVSHNAMGQTQTGIKTLPCAKLCLQAVTKIPIGFCSQFIGVSLCCCT